MHQLAAHTTYSKTTLNYFYDSSSVVMAPTAYPAHSTQTKHSFPVVKAAYPIHIENKTNTCTSSPAVYQMRRLVKLTAIVTVRGRRHTPKLLETLVERGFDSFLQESLSALNPIKPEPAAGSKVMLQLISTKADEHSGTRMGLVSHVSMLQDWEKKARCISDKVQFIAEFIVSKDFGRPGAIKVINQDSHECYIETIAVEGWEGGKIIFPCYSWVHSKSNNSDESIFFSNEAYLPINTPEGLKYLREAQKISKRGNGQGERKPHEHIYDYDIYNDLGNPDLSLDLARPPLGSDVNLPYPRRMRTGRPTAKTDENAESVLPRGYYNYVPRNDTFDDLKYKNYILWNIKFFLHELPLNIEKTLTKTLEFNSLNDIDKLYEENLVKRLCNIHLDQLEKTLALPKLYDKLEDSLMSINFRPPKHFAKDRFSWLHDVEFGRQALAGANPLQIQIMKFFPPVSSLDPNIYGPVESAIKPEHIQRQLGGLSIQQAIEQKRLFIVDYHDAYMPFINRINELPDRKMYASRTVLFLNEAGCLSPVAIELSLPPSSPGREGSKRVFKPGVDATSNWLWQLAKIHAASVDAGYHQLVNHWLRSHAAVEPYVIATHRQLTTMHPIFKLLHPHLRYTLEINALARQQLINADGVIETCFTPGPYCTEISSAVYKSMWRFDMESLPADLVRRGMAEEDPKNPGKIKLVIEDYPYATDGLLIWNAIHDWVSEYVSLYYSDPESIASDTEIQSWWHEIRYTGHGDKSNESWWPQLNSKEDLVSILSIIIWVASAHHAAVNFGQYPYGGYMPNRPCMTRRLIPEEDENSIDYWELIKDPEKFLLSMISNKHQTTYVMSVMDYLSNHAVDEEYLGQREQINWTSDMRAMFAADSFTKRIKQIDMIIDKRNADLKNKNRTGAGTLAYELLRPSSGPGVTGKGVPNSSSI